MILDSLQCALGHPHAHLTTGTAVHSLKYLFCSIYPHLCRGVLAGDPAAETLQAMASFSPGARTALCTYNAQFLWPCTPMATEPAVREESTDHDIIALVPAAWDSIKRGSSWALHAIVERDAKHVKTLLYLSRV